MNTIEAFNRNTKTKGQLNTLRKKGEVPGIVYGGKDANQKISLLKKEVKNLIESENFKFDGVDGSFYFKNNLIERELKILQINSGKAVQIN